MRFDICAHTYDEHAGPQRFFAERVAQFIGAKPQGSIVELGAGTGALTRCLAGPPSMASARLSKVSPPSKAVIAAQLFATDVSPKMVERGRLAVPEAQWSVLDAFREPIPIAALQVSSGLLHWADDPEVVIKRWKTYLTPSGRMIHAIPCEPCLAEWRSLVPESPVPWRNESEWLKIFERAGLQVTRSLNWTHTDTCSSALEMVRGFHRTGVTGRMRVGPARLRQALRAYDQKHGAANGVNITWTWLAIEAC